MDGKEVRVLDVRGKPVEAKALPERLKERTAVLLCVTGRPPDPRPKQVRSKCSLTDSKARPWLAFSTRR